MLNNFVNDSRVLKECRSINSKLNIDVYVYALHEKGLANEEENDFLKLRRFKLKTRGWSKKIYVQLIKYIECFLRMYKGAIELKPDIVHAHDLNALPIGVSISKRLKIPMIYDAHEFETEQKNELYRSAFIHNVLIKIENNLIKSANDVITVSEGIADAYSLQYGISKPELVLNCPPKYSRGESTLLRDYFGIQAQGVIFLYQGGLSEDRGLDQILEAFSTITDQKANLVIMGYGEKERIVKDYADKYTNIFYKEAVAPEDLLAWTSSADVGILTYENTCLNNYYCLPNKLFEYFQAGLPVIVSSLFELRKIVEQYSIGWVLKNNNAEELKSIVLNVLENGWTKEKKNIDQVIERYTWEEQEKVLLKIYERCLKFPNN